MPLDDAAADIALIIDVTAMPPWRFSPIAMPLWFDIIFLLDTPPPSHAAVISLLLLMPLADANDMPLAFTMPSLRDNRYHRTLFFFMPFATLRHYAFATAFISHCLRHADGFAIITILLLRFSCHTPYHAKELILIYALRRDTLLLRHVAFALRCLI